MRTGSSSPKARSCSNAAASSTADASAACRSCAMRSTTSCSRWRNGDGGSRREQAHQRHQDERSREKWTGHRFAERDHARHLWHDRRQLGNTREVLTDPLTNYNVVVADQQLPNNGYVSVINTNVTRDGDVYDANSYGLRLPVEQQGAHDPRRWRSSRISQQYGRATGRDPGLFILRRVLRKDRWRVDLRRGVQRGLTGLRPERSRLLAVHQLPRRRRPASTTPSTSPRRHGSAGAWRPSKANTCAWCSRTTSSTSPWSSARSGCFKGSTHSVEACAPNRWSPTTPSRRVCPAGCTSSP